MANAGSEVLRTPELLEAILLELPPRKILLTQRVSKFWHTTVTNSPSLQQKLFFTPSNSTAHDSTKLPVLNPMLSHIHAGRYRVSVHGDECGRYAVEQLMDEDLDPDDSIHVCIENTDLTAPDMAVDALASWNSMLLSNPPCPIYFAKLSPSRFAMKRVCFRKVEASVLGEMFEAMNKQPT